MKIFIVGSDKIYAIENFYVRHLRDLGAEVFHFPAQTIFYDYYHRGLGPKILFKSGLSRIYQIINQACRKAITGFKPDVVWVFKGMEIIPETLEWIRLQGIPLVSYNPDNPFIFTGKGSGNKNITSNNRLYDLHFTYSLEIKVELEACFQRAVEILPFGYELDDEQFNACQKEEEVLRACFLGNPDSQRAEFIQKLAEEVAIDLYGNYWDKFVRHPNIRIYKPVYGEEFWRVLRRYRVQLNLMRLHNLNSHNMRTFEVPGVGGVLLAPDTVEHRMYYLPEQEIFLYSDLVECKEQIKFIFDQSPKYIAQVRQSARYRSVASGYSYRDRAKQAYDKLKLFLE